VTLDPARDPDRYEAAREEVPSGPLDWALDPDRYVPEPRDEERYDPASDDGARLRRPTLPGLLGEGANEDERDNLTWLLGLVAVLAFLGAVSLLVRLGSG